ncbi:Major facilitator superfamily domain general substrate transporter [Penicillium cosmopolitanum]|uniref:Major facilitator superfamily domain general substrate transporter n=1 Tax=Penicillium cosmopolitanum TaxID=1131564 RepID=A0A9W9W377_9EURO|nr:Major facilitator superfamily domain general substrate transporter [Penicillium cosmopolitanum]KAJ5397631.1 Major facilitator superfamily domain general substrate transporter [Penicillium cosmopolitanum]
MSTDEDNESRSAIPLSRQKIEDLERDVRQFWERLELQNTVRIETLIKGAKIAKDPPNVALIGLSGPERQAIFSEKRQLPWQARGLLVTVMVTACAAITQGWQQSTINGSALFSWWESVGLQKPKDELLIGVINAAPWLSASLVGTWLSDPLQDRYGRRPALFVAALFCVFLVIGTAQCNHWKTLLVCRCLLGVGIGSKASIAPVFAAEAAPDEHRGRVLMMWQLFDTFGIFLGFLCAFLVRGDWRILLATAIIPAIVLLFLVFICPESPRFLIQKHRYVEAYKSLLELRGTEIQAARDLYNIHSQLQVEATKIWKSPNERLWSEQENRYIYQRWISKRNFFSRMWYLFTDPRSRRACMVALIVMLSQQLCGMNVLAFYSSDLIKSSGMTDFTPRIESYNLGFGLANFLFTFPAFFFIDSSGRRPLLLVSFSGMLCSLAAVAGFFKLTDPETRLILVAIISIAVFVFFYSIGAGPIPFTLSAEVFPLHVRDVGMSFSVMINFLFLGLLVFAVPSLTTKFGHGNVCGEASENLCNGQANLLGFFT